MTLGTDFFDESQPLNKKALRAAGTPAVYTGPIDRYFGYELGDLKWRTVDFKEVRYDEDDHFGCPVMNFSDADVPYTRAIEFKNFNPERRDAQNHNRTVVWEEYSRFAERGDEPYTRSTRTPTRRSMSGTQPGQPPSRTSCSAGAWAPTSTTTCTT